MKGRCPWANGSQIYERYHDEEWGVPLHDDKRIFEFINLEGAQAGLSWLTILKRREGYKKAFMDFDPKKVAKFDDSDKARLLQDPGIIRNRAKINAAVSNARCFLDVQAEFGSFDRYIWEFVGGKPIVNRFEKASQLPAKTPLSERISADLRSRGFKFVGPTIVYAHMQATGMVNDHLVSCPRRKEIQKL